MKDFGPFNKYYFPTEEESKEGLLNTFENKNKDTKPTFFNPTSYSEANAIADCMISGKSVIVNLELLFNDENKKNEGIRIVDYLCGVSYCVKMNVVKINGSTFYFSKE